jgi:phage anti-repressor protein
MKTTIKKVFSPNGDQRFDVLADGKFIFCKHFSPNREGDEKEKYEICLNGAKNMELYGTVEREEIVYETTLQYVVDSTVEEIRNNIATDLAKTDEI